jgi:membrane protease YdiL (CAAX protease family)
VTDRGRLIGWALLVGVLATIGYATRAAEGRPPKNLLYHYGTAFGGLVQYGIILGIVLALARGPGMGERLALRRPYSWPRALGLGVATLIAVYVFAAVLDTFLNPGREQGLTPDHWDPSRAGAYAANFVVVAVVAPIVEELMFRGLGFSLLRRYGEWAAILLVGLAFGLYHGLFEALPILAFFGACLAFVRSRTGSVYPGMLVHATFNSIALVVAVTV